MFPSVYRKAKGSQFIDRSKITQISTFASASLTTTYQPILSLTSKGYLDTFMMNGTATNVTNVRITVDGVVKFEGSASTPGSVSGIIMRSLLHAIGASISPSVQSTTALGTFVGFNSIVVGYPYTTNTSQAGTLCIIPESLYFKNSLLIEAKLTTGGPSSTAYYVAGGAMQ